MDLGKSFFRFAMGFCFAYLAMDSLFEIIKGRDMAVIAFFFSMFGYIYLLTNTGDSIPI